MRRRARAGARAAVPDAPAHAARRRGRRLRRRGAGQARDPGDAVRALLRAPPARRQRARARVPGLGRRAGRAAAALRAVRGAARASRRRRTRQRRLAALAGAVPRSRFTRDQTLRARTPGADRVLRLPAVAVRAAARRRARRRRGGGAARGPLPRPRGVGRGLRRRRLGPAVALRVHRRGRRAAGRLQRAGPELGARAAAARRTRRRGIRAVDRGPAPEHARHRRAAHRPRDGAVAAVLDSRRRRAGAGNLRHVPARGLARHPRPREPAQPLRGDRRGPRHGPGGGPRRDAADGHPVVPPADVREGRGRRVQGAGHVSGGGAGRLHLARPAHARGVLGGTRPRAARRARHLWRRRRARRRGRRPCRGSPRPPRRAGARGPAPGRHDGEPRGGAGDDAGARLRAARAAGALAGAVRARPARGRAAPGRPGQRPGHRRGPLPELAPPALAAARAVAAVGGVHRADRPARGRAAQRAAAARQRRAPPCRDPARDLPAAAARGLRLPGRGGHRSLSGPAGRQPLLLLAVPQGPPRQHARLRRRRPQRVQSRARQRRGLRAPHRGAARAGRSAWSWTSCPTTWA